MQIDLKALTGMADIRIHFLGNTFTVATARIRIMEKLFIGEGISRRSHLDAYNKDDGLDVCIGRAVKALRRKIVWGDGRPIHHKYMG